MPLDPPVAAVLEMLANSGTPMSMVDGTPQQAREGFKTMTYGVRDPATLAPVRSVDDDTIPGPAGDIPIRIYRPDVDGSVPTVVFIHGGGFVIGDLDTHDDHARLICHDVEAVVVSVDYRLAPEHPFPAGFEDCFAATRWVADHIAELGGDANRIAVAGDSAGGNLSAAVALAATREGGPQLAAQLLIYPGVDFRSDDSLHASRTENGEGYFLTLAHKHLVIQAFGHTYWRNVQSRHEGEAGEVAVAVWPEVDGVINFPPAKAIADGYALGDFARLPTVFRPDLSA